MTPEQRANKKDRVRLNWRQGQLLLTSRTERWTVRERDEAQERESLRVFRNFTERDEGKGRELVCECRRAEDAERIVRMIHFLKQVHSDDRLPESLRLQALNLLLETYD